MCAILDASVVNQVFGKGQSEAGKKFRQWINARKGLLVVGGKQLDELKRGSSEFKEWAAQAMSAGLMKRVNAEKVNAKADELEREGQCQSDDCHVVALAQVSGARLLYSNDLNLHQDFGNPHLISGPRGKVYSTLRTQDYSKIHENLLKRNDLCRIRR